MTSPDVLGMSVRELLLELATLQDEINRTAARAGYSPSPPPHPAETVPDLPDDPRQGHHVRDDTAGIAPGALGISEALDLLETLEQRERTVLAELHRRATPGPPDALKPPPT